MMSRGTKLIEKARKERTERATSFGQGGSAATVESDCTFVQLQRKIGRVSQLPPWDKMAVDQEAVTTDKLRKSKTGDAFALEDRNVMSDPWRKVFVVRDGNDFHLFSTAGELIDEPQVGGVLEGRQSVATLLEEFSEEGFYYRPPDTQLIARARRHTQREARGNQPPLDVEAAEGGRFISDDQFEVDHLSSSSSESEHEDPPTRSTANTDLRIEPPRPTDDGPSDGVMDTEAASDQAAAASATPANSRPEDQSESEDDGDPERTGCGDEVESANAQSSAADNEGVDPPCILSVGTRVSIHKDDGTRGGGMVANRGFASILVATDEGCWQSIPLSDVGTKLVAEALEETEDDTGVAALAFNHANTQVTGMLLGRCDEMVMGGKLRAFYSHIARPSDDRDTRLRPGRAAANHACKHSFSLGDFVKQLGHPNEPLGFGVVVRVLYSRRGKAQARRMLVLTEVFADLKLTISKDDPPVFFPASWMNWSRVENKSSLSYAEIPLLNEV